MADQNPPRPEGGAVDLPPLREVIKRYGLDARRALGQNFLLDGNLTARIARSAGDLTGCHVIEIGPGPGGLTRALLATRAAHVTAVERDSRFRAPLEELQTLYPGRLTVMEADALEIAPETLTPAPRAIVANLPYNVATPLLLRWLDVIGAFQQLVLLFQKEVAERITARAGDPQYGRLAVATQWRAEARKLFDIGPKAFVPAPKVTSTLIRVAPRREPLAPADPQVLARITQAAFGQRRKMLRSSLRSLGDGLAERLLSEAGIEGTRRAEELSIPEFCALARAFSAASTTGPAAESGKTNDDP